MRVGRGSQVDFRAAIPLEWWVGLGLLALSGCHNDMYDQPKYEPLEASTFFSNGQSSRPLVAGTVARGQLHDDEARYQGKVDGKLVTTFPYPVDRAMLDRGRQRYMIYCTPCHGIKGDGQGMIVKRGFSPPPSFQIDRLREAPVGHYYDVITHGYGAMYPYASRVAPDDRWAIAAYIRALQLSQHASYDDLDVRDKRLLRETR